MRLTARPTPNRTRALRAAAGLLVMLTSPVCADIGPSSELPSAAAAPNETREGRPDLSGSWVLNKTRSDDLQEKLRKAMADDRAGHPGEGAGRMGGMGGGMGGMGGGRRGGMGGDGAGRARMGMRGEGAPEATRFPEALVVEHSDPLFAITNENGQRQRLFTDNRGISVSASGGLQQTVATAGWEGDVLVVETHHDNGRSIEERYRLQATPRQLQVITRLRLGPDGKIIEFRRIYEPEGHVSTETASVEPATEGQAPDHPAVGK